MIIQCSTSTSPASLMCSRIPIDGETTGTKWHCFMVLTVAASFILFPRFCGASLPQRSRATQASSLASTTMPLSIRPVMALQAVPDEVGNVAAQMLPLFAHLPLPSSSLPGAARELAAACCAADWSLRASALMFVAAFTYRHAFLLDGADFNCLREAVLGLLSDPQPEVRTDGR